jgi:sugar phosphate isomerase/epimerase
LQRSASTRWSFSTTSAGNLGRFETSSIGSDWKRPRPTFPGRPSKRGHSYVLLAWLPPEDRSSLAQYRDLAALCNEVGKTCTSAGLQFAYHNHDFEFRTIDGQVPFDVLLNETDPDHVEFEIDLYWITKGGRDPLDYFQAHPGRFTLCHVKDMAEGGAMADVGSGQIDFAAIFARSEQAGLRYFFVEHDEPPDPLASIDSSFNYLKTLRF